MLHGAVFPFNGSITALIKAYAVFYANPHVRHIQCNTSVTGRADDHTRILFSQAPQEICSEGKMAVTYKKKMILVGMMLAISSMGLFLVISTDDVKNNNRVDFKIVDNSTGDYTVTYDPYTGQPHVYKKTVTP